MIHQTNTEIVWVSSCGNVAEDDLGFGQGLGSRVVLI